MLTKFNRKIFRLRELGVLVSRLGTNNPAFVYLLPTYQFTLATKNFTDDKINHTLQNYVF
ncbi:hypothetical protein BpHYR1_011761 [Brachionus plicatilis]|uniref:Uncharacterized protein n=1 Tax=Brachionus plicatilis TaxID=10195 RepID=A0A3M7P9I4_BRAPC|nr:hypothetical protein BpHYR1_011761 [Brachionus plicatilis]